MQKHKLNKIKLILMLVGVLLFSSCANFFIRQQCEKLNWYQLGYEAALRGDRISNDSQINQCRKAEAEISESQLDLGFKAGMSRYCQPDTAFQTGKQGDTLNSDFCESHTLGLLKKKFTEGQRAYCSDGFTAGQSGKKYKNVCGQEFEKFFIPEYKKGRKKYLNNLIQIAEKNRKENESEIYRITNEKIILDRRLSFLPLIKAGEKDPYFHDRTQLSNQIQQMSSQLSIARDKKRQLETQISEYQTDVATLD